MEKEVLEEYISLFEKVAHKSANLKNFKRSMNPIVFLMIWKYGNFMQPIS